MPLGASITQGVGSTPENGKEFEVYTLCSILECDQQSDTVDVSLRILYESFELTLLQVIANLLEMS